ncbi:hypothetical protein Tco_0906863 [Tanacetum coccineum]|uniref:Uncharacterized protein n=1 Tax=Tanacetum coccineum TaxID=301880 RepID=A0ABQ5CIL5_9ASTR
MDIRNQFTLVLNAKLKTKRKGKFDYTTKLKQQFPRRLNVAQAYHRWDWEGRSMLEIYHCENKSMFHLNGPAEGTGSTWIGACLRRMEKTLKTLKRHEGTISVLRLLPLDNYIVFPLKFPL